MGFIDGLFNAVKSKYERDMSSYFNIKFCTATCTHHIALFSGNSSKQIGQAKAMGDELKRRGLR